MKPKTTISRRLVSGVIWATGGKILFMLGTLAWNALLTRILSETEVGAFYLIASVVLFVELVVLGGMNQAVVRLIAANSLSKIGIRPAIRGTAFLVVFFALTIGLIYFWIIGPWLGQQVFHSRLIGELAGFTAAWFALRAIQTYLAFILRGFHRVGIAAYVDGTSTAIFIALAMGYLWICPDLSGIRDVLAIVIGALTCTCILALFLVQKSYRKTEQEPGILLMKSIRIGTPLSIVAISGVGINEAHIWIAGIFVSHADVAIYGAAMRLAKFVQMPLLIINGVISSTIAQLFATNNKARMEKVLQASAVTAVLPCLMFAFIVFLASGDILALVFGPSYSAGGTILVILVLGQTVCVAVGSPGVLMAMTGRQTASMLIAASSGLVGIGISLSLVEAQGIIGVTIGATAGKVLYNFGLWAYCLKMLGIKTHASPFNITDVIHALKKS